MKSSAKNSSWLRRLAENPILNITVGFILLAAGLLESLEPIFGNFSPLGVHHATALLGLVQFLKWLPDVFKGLQFVEHGDEKVALQARSDG